MGPLGYSPYVNPALVIKKKFFLVCFIEALRVEEVILLSPGARCSSVVRAFAQGAMGRRIDPSWGGSIELFLVPASAPRLV